MATKSRSRSKSRGRSPATFARQWAVQSPKIGWLLGAGASAAARVPTADHVMMDLLLRMYADAHQLVRQNLSLSEARDRDRIREYYDNRNGMPALSDPLAYSVAFQLALPDAGARRQHLRSLFEGRSPSYGQRILGAFVAAGLSDLVITTNFDDLIEKAVEQAQVTLGDPTRSRLGVADLGNPGQANLALSDSAFPFLFKLHGDFRDREPARGTADDVLALTKMDWNNDALYDPLPVSIKYSQTLARVIGHTRGLPDAV